MKTKKTLKIITTKFSAGLVLFLSPAVALASYCSDTNISTVDIKSSDTTLATIVKFLTCFIASAVVPLMFSVAFLIFVYSTIGFMQATDSNERSEKRMTMVWSIVAFAVMVSVWGLVKILGNTIGVDATFIPQIQPTH